MINDSGTRREFESGAVRDCPEGKGRRRSGKEVRMADYRLPEDIKLAAMSLVKGYDRRKKDFDAQVRDIIEETAEV